MKSILFSLLLFSRSFSCDPATKTDETFALMNINVNVENPTVQVNGIVSNDPLNKVRVPRGEKFTIQLFKDGYRPFFGRAVINAEKGSASFKMIKISTE